MKFFVYILCFIFSFPVFAGDIVKNGAFDKFASQVSVENVKFTQTKTIPNIKRNFVSNGFIKFVKNVGFVWVQNLPNSIKFIGTQKQYCVNDEVKNLSDLPYFSQIQMVVDDLLLGNYKSLNSAFNVDYSDDGENWNLFLTPKNSRISSFIKVVQVSGDVSLLKEIVIDYSNGMEITIDFEVFKGEISDEIQC